MSLFTSSLKILMPSGYREAIHTASSKTEIISSEISSRNCGQIARYYLLKYSKKHWKSVAQTLCCCLNTSKASSKRHNRDKQILYCPQRNNSMTSLCCSENNTKSLCAVQLALWPYGQSCHRNCFVLSKTPTC